MNRLALALATWFGCGYSPFAPGTAGSLGALVVAWACTYFFAWPPIAFAWLAVVFTLPGVWSAGIAANISGRKDPGLVVIDEVVGQWITLAAAPHFHLVPVLAAFALFRLFDVWKPFPARDAEALPGGWGIVTDDVIAGMYGALVLWLLGHWGLL